MEKVHIFISVGRFASFEDMRAYIDPVYTSDGEAVASAFMNEVGLEGYEPGCIEALFSGRAVPLSELIDSSSYSYGWRRQFSDSRLVDSAICVYAPNRVSNPGGSSTEYYGGFDFET